MKTFFRVKALSFPTIVFFVLSCQRPEQEPVNLPPIANAGNDQVIDLPVNSVTLNGSASTDPENKIKEFAWRKISGPASFKFSNSYTIQIDVYDLVEGLYQFELKVTDQGDLYSKDTVDIKVNNPSQGQNPGPTVILPTCDKTSRQTVNATLIPLGKLSKARVGMAVAGAGDHIVFAGGQGTGVPEEWGSSRVDIYRISTNAWSTSELKTSRYGIASIAVGNKIFFAGGQNGDGAFNQSFSTVDIYDVSQNKWSEMNLSEARGFMAAATVGNLVFFARDRS
jgi:hypothetical protein